MKKRILSIVLAIFMVLALVPTAALAAVPDVWDGSTQTPSGSGSESDPYLISTGEELAWLATLAAEGSYFVKLTNDIILNDGTFDQSGNFTKTGETSASTPHAWTPTAKAVWHIDGNDHYISGLYINSDSADNVGLFSYLYGNAVQRSCVKDLTIKNSYVRLTRDNPQYGYGKAGIFAGMSYRTDFINCVGENNILSTTCYATAGIVGESDNCSFNGVHTSGSVNGSNILGGLAGRDRDSTFKNCWNETNIDNVNRSIHQCGGIAGMASNSNFYNCANLGYLHGGSRVGGIVGEAKAVTIKNCYGLSDIENYASEWNYDWETETGRNVYNIGTLAGTGASVSLSYAEDGFERNDNGETGVVPHFTGKGKLTESGTDDDLLNALNENLYEMDGEEGLNEWSRTNDGYPLPNGGSFVNTATYYNIWLDGVRVSERNQNDILKNGLASYDDGTNTLYLHDGLVVTNPYNNSLLYTEGDINLCVDGSVEFRSAQNVGGGPSVINLGEAGGSGRLKIYAPTDKSAAVTVTGAYSEYGINVNSLTLDGDVCLTVRTNEPCFAFTYTFTLLSSEAVLDAENLSGNPSMLNFVYSVNLPSTNPQKLYEGTGIDLTCVEQFTKERETESGTTEPYMYPHIRIAPEVYDLIDTLPKSLTVSMTEANTQAALSTWAAGQIRTGDITTGNSEITVSDVVSAVAGSDTNQSGTDGNFTVTVKLTKNGISKTTTIPGTITATAYVPPHTHCVCGGDTDVGDHTSHTDVTYQPWDGTSAIDYGDDNTAYVYLTNDVTIQSNLEITGGKTLYLCLNGKTFASNGTNKIVVKENSRLILCDCAGGGTIDGADSGWGGTGIYLYNSTMDMYGGKITGGYASGNGGGGAIALDDVNCVFNMYGGEISGNRANRYGGAIFLNGTLQTKKGGTVNLYGGTIKNNSAKIGGAIYAVYGGTVNLCGGEISGNKATANGGGAICLNHSGVLNMTGGKMQNNTAKTDGGAVNLFASTFTFSAGTISNNHASEYGGAVYLSTSCTLNMTGGEICNNRAAEEGGAVHVYGKNSTFNLSGGTITGNEAVDGGAVYLNQEQSTLNMSGGEISGNKATRYGGAVYMFRETSTLNLSGGTIKNNTAASSGGAVYFNTTSDGKIQGILNISGNPVVKDNTVSGKANNISLKSGKTLSIVGAMTDGASVGITTESTNYPVVFSNAYGNDYSGYFFADDANAYVRQDSGYRLELATGTPHKHSWATEWTTDGTYHWHECTAKGCDVTNDAEKQGYGAHSGTDDGDCTTAVICECGYTITAANAEHTYGAWHSNGDNTHTRNCTVTDCNGYETKNCAGGQATYFKKAVCDTCHAEYGALRTDSTAPTGEIAVGTNKWNSFLNTITFGLFFKDTQSVTIMATDDSYNHDGYTDDKAVKVEYYLYSGDTALTQADLANKEFTVYNGAFNINPDNKYVVYARLTDHAGNVTYISSEGVVLDATTPVISGVENGKTYCEAQTVTVTEEYIESVKVNGTAVTLDANNQFTLNPAEGTQKIVVTDKAGNVSVEITVTVNNGHTAGNDDGNCTTPVYCIYHPDTVVVAANSHDFSGEWHNDGTGHWHICQNDGCTVAEPKASHFGTDDGDCTTAVICECGYTITAANAEHTYGAWHSNGDNTHTRNCTVTGCNGYETKDCAGGQATYFKKAVCDTCHAEYGSLLTDSTAPTGEISIGTNKWNSFLNTITFGLFFKDTQSVAITAADDSYNRDGYTDDKAVKVAYYLHSGDTALTQADLAGKEFTEYSRAFNINPDNKYVVYARLTDHAGNITYISSEGVVLDASAPVISGVENGKTYCEAQTVTVTEEYIESVKVNGTAVTLDANNQFTLNPAEGTQKIVATDKAGNVSVEITVTVNNGHTYEWQSENGQYWKKCQYCDDETAKKDIPTITINGADAVCVTQDYKFSFTLPEGATDAVYGYEFENKGDLGLQAIIENNEPHGVVSMEWYEPSENSFKVYAGAKTADGFEFFVSKTIALKSEHTDAAPKDHICDICGATLSEHTGGEATCVGKAICEYCGEEYGELDSTNHNLEKTPAKDATVTETGNKEYWHCKDCGKYFSDENGTNEIKFADTVIAKLPPEIIKGAGQSITEGEKKELSFTSNAAFSDFIRFELDGKTLDEKDYTVKEGSTVVNLKADYVATLSAGEHTIGIVSESGTATTTFTVKPKRAVDNDKKSPQTGDNSHMALWVVLLFVSSVALNATAGVSKKKKRSKN